MCRPETKKNDKYQQQRLCPNIYWSRDSKLELKTGRTQYQSTLNTSCQILAVQIRKNEHRKAASQD